MSIFDAFKKSKEKTVPTPEEYETGRIYDYSTSDNRVATAEWLLQQAKDERTAKENEWVKMNDYYNFNHDIKQEMKEALYEAEIPFVPAVVPDAYVMVESQISPDVPMPEFHGRDDDDDDEKAKERALAVRFVIENNRLNDMNTANERRLRKFGDAFWKAYWDESMPCGPNFGDIRVKDIPLEDIYPDPTAMTLNECEYVDYVYTLHKNRFWRMYSKEVMAQGYSLDDIMTEQYRERDGLLDPYTKGSNARDDMVQVLEHWFRQPFDDPNGNYKSGDIACTIQAGGIELKYIEKYWKNTGEQCKIYPFVHYWCINDETGFWNRSEIEPIIDIIDSADRELSVGLLNDALMGNDVIIYEKDSLEDGEEVTNMPGSSICMKKGMINAIKRLGGLGNGIQAVSMIEWLQGEIQRTNRNYDTNNGQETAKVTTASGLLQLRSDAAVQSELKKADRNKGFCRLYELIDWLCLEFYTDERMLYIGAKDANSQPEKMRYTPFRFLTVEQAEIDEQTGETLVPEKKYYPRVDVTVTAGDGISKSPAMTIQILDRLAAVGVTADNYKLLAAELEYLDIPQKQEIIEGWKEKFEPQEEMAAAVPGMELPEENTQGSTPMGAPDIVGGNEFDVPTF